MKKKVFEMMVLFFVFAFNVSANILSESPPFKKDSDNLNEARVCVAVKINEPAVFIQYRLVCDNGAYATGGYKITGILPYHWGNASRRKLRNTMAKKGFFQTNDINTSSIIKSRWDSIYELDRVLVFERNKESNELYCVVDMNSRLEEVSSDLIRRKHFATVYCDEIIGHMTMEFDSRKELEEYLEIDEQMEKVISFDQFQNLNSDIQGRLFVYKWNK